MCRVGTVKTLCKLVVDDGCGGLQPPTNAYFVQYGVSDFGITGRISGRALGKGKTMKMSWNPNVTTARMTNKDFEVSQETNGNPTSAVLRFVGRRNWCRPQGVWLRAFWRWLCVLTVRDFEACSSTPGERCRDCWILPHQSVYNCILYHRWTSKKMPAIVPRTSSKKPIPHLPFWPWSTPRAGVIVRGVRIHYWRWNIGG